MIIVVYHYISHLFPSLVISVTSIVIIWVLHRHMLLYLKLRLVWAILGKADAAARINVDAWSDLVLIVLVLLEHLSLVLDNVHLFSQVFYVNVLSSLRFMKEDQISKFFVNCLADLSLFFVE